MRPALRRREPEGVREPSSAMRRPAEAEKMWSPPSSSAPTTARSPRSGRSARSSGTSSGNRRHWSGRPVPLGGNAGGRAGIVPGSGHGGHPGAPGGEPASAAAAVVRQRRHGSSGAGPSCCGPGTGRRRWRRRSGCGPSAPATPSASGWTRRPTAPAGCSMRPAC